MFYLKSLKGLPETIQLMTTSPKQVLALVSGITAIVTSGVVVSKVPDSLTATKVATETTKQEEEKTKQATIVSTQTTKQVEAIEKTKQMDLELQILKLKKRWF
jgi:hypothetical protein